MDKDNGHARLTRHNAIEKPTQSTLRSRNNLLVVTYCALLRDFTFECFESNTMPVFCLWQPRYLVSKIVTKDLMVFFVFFCFVFF